MGEDCREETQRLGNINKFGLYIKRSSVSHDPISFSEGSWWQLLWRSSRKGQAVEQSSREKRPSLDKGRWHGEKWMELRAE